MSLDDAIQKARALAAMAQPIVVPHSLAETTNGDLGFGMPTRMTRTHASNILEVSQDLPEYLQLHQGNSPVK